jgi:hypothetical protein
MVEIVEKMYCIDKIDMVDLVGQSRLPHPRKEVSTATNERKRRPGCNRAAHDPE